MVAPKAKESPIGTPAQALRELLSRGEPFIAADAWNAITGRIVEYVGFPAMYLGGHACGATNYAVPDNGVFTQTEQIFEASRIVEATTIPLIVDADTLGETIADAFRFTRRYEHVGVAGIHVEDETNPKHSRYDNPLVSIEEMQAKLDACTKARRDSAFVIMARCDELFAEGGGGSGSLEETIKRGQAYAEAGADVLLVPFATPEQNAEIIREVPITVGSMGPLAEGTAFALHGGWGWGSAIRLHLQLCRQLMETGEVDGLDISFDGKSEMLEEHLYGDLIAGWAERTGKPVRESIGHPTGPPVEA